VHIPGTIALPDFNEPALSIYALDNIAIKRVAERVVDDNWILTKQIVLTNTRGAHG